MEADLHMMVLDDELDEKGRPLIDWVKPVECLLPNAEVYEEWEEDEEDEDVDSIDLYGSGDAGGNGSEVSDKVYAEGEIDEDDDEDVEGEQEDMGGSRTTWRAGRKVIMMSIGRTKGKRPAQVWEVGCQTYFALTLHLPLVVCTVMLQNTVSVLAPKRWGRGGLGVQ